MIVFWIHRVNELNQIFKLISPVSLHVFNVAPVIFLLDGADLVGKNITNSPAHFVYLRVHCR